MSGERSTDVIVIGAGAAGIAAARTLRAAGHAVRVLEAKARVGGRAWTEDQSLGWPFDRGCGWLHSADINPLTSAAEDRGLALARGAMHMQIHLGDRWATMDEVGEAEAFWRACQEVMANSAADRPAAEAVPDHPRWGRFFRYLNTAICGVDPEHYSTADFAAEQDTGADWAVCDGLGRLIAGLAEGIPVDLGTPVRTVEWDRNRVRVTTAQGEAITAITVIVTVSTAVLATGDLQFRPALPAWKQKALTDVPLGASEKLGLAFEPDPLVVPPDTFLTLLGGEEPIGFHLRPCGRPLAVSYLGGALARRFRGEGERGAVARALDALEEAFGPGVCTAFRAGTLTGWARDPHVLGGYSAAVPGRAHARRALAAPLGERVHFAGEATSPEAFATVHGAWQSGIRAAEAVLS